MTVHICIVLKLPKPV